MARKPPQNVHIWKRKFRPERSCCPRYVFSHADTVTMLVLKTHASIIFRQLFELMHAAMIFVTEVFLFSNGTSRKAGLGKRLRCAVTYVHAEDPSYKRYIVSDLPVCLSVWVYYCCLNFKTSKSGMFEKVVFVPPSHLFQSF